jgi:CheY-like chemotaxis protein
MSWLLVVQPDAVQAGALREALLAQLTEDVVVADSIQEALALIDERVPDLILLPTLMSAMEDHLLAYLGAIPSARHVQILGLPRLERPEDVVIQPRQRRFRFRWPWLRRKGAPVIVPPGCNPVAFSQDVASYLASARALKRDLEMYGSMAPGADRRTAPRFGLDEVPWITYARFAGEQATLVNVSSSGALLRTASRPDAELLRRAVPDVWQRKGLTLEMAEDVDVHTTGRVIRCVRLVTSMGPQYEIAFSFNEAVGLHLPGTGDLVPAGTVFDDDV